MSQLKTPALSRHVPAKDSSFVPAEVCGKFLESIPVPAEVDGKLTKSIPVSAKECSHVPAEVDGEMTVCICSKVSNRSSQYLNLPLSDLVFSQ